MINLERGDLELSVNGTDTDSSGAAAADDESLSRFSRDGQAVRRIAVALRETKALDPTQGLPRFGRGTGGRRINLGGPPAETSEL